MQIRKLITLTLMALFTQYIAAEEIFSPEEALSKYLMCLEQADEACVLRIYYGIDQFHISAKSEIEHSILQKIVVSELVATQWNSSGIVPKAYAGDVQLDVAQTTKSNTSKYSYFLRKVNGSWYI